MSNEELRNLNENELEEVNGGKGGESPLNGKAVELIGEYYADSYADSRKFKTAIGWKNLTIGRVFIGRKAPYEIKHNGVTIGWAPEKSIKIK